MDEVRQYDIMRIKCILICFLVSNIFVSLLFIINKIY